ncbi:MarR family winged helix-turn-helix transcriptional regulator [Litorihabitans aurantiacus]|uniref:Transcriptional regulator n=1 Tax=Litorihabitans aurantiacus TaxID=1930061 RepID=A0AA37XEN0_9MICO|nr:MarR family transcriptional regulator [Litorihabitans aurantiacus]GMA31923.1 transcriptional regulator [Litorihabitans aurantiacus]
MTDRPPSDHVETIQREWRRERPDVDPSPQAVIGRLHRLGGLLMAQLETVYAAHGLSQGEFDVLMTLRRAGDPYERTPTDLAARTMVTSGATSKRVDRLERAGLVARRRSAEDGRGRVVALTPAGLAAADAAYTDHMANEHRLVADLSGRDRDDLARILSAWLVRTDPDGVAPDA